MKLVIGLGNPGEKYKNTRHNVGQMVIDAIKNSRLKEFQNSRQIKIFKSDKFMNESGNFVKSLSIRYSLLPSALYVIHDDLDIKLGDYKIQFGKGPKDHNGLNDIYDKLGTKDFWHVRVGIDARLKDEKNSRISGEEYVLQDFTEEEKNVLDKVLKEICKRLVTL